MALATVFTEKQINVLQQAKNNHDWRLMINYGAQRSGKTFVDNFIFLNDLQHAAELAKAEHDSSPKYILAGVSDKTIYNNVVSELENTFGLTFQRDSHKSLRVKFPGLPELLVVQAYTGSIAGLRGIRGMTAYGAYINEASLAVEVVFDEIRKRCSKAGARVICDTNPDIPTHYLKTKYIDNKSKHIISNHFTIYDNDRLPQDYIENQIETTPKGMFFDRDILGLWVSGEGLVYADFDKDSMSIEPNDIPVNLHIFGGIDFGWNHFGSLVIIGRDDNGKFYLLEEHTRRHKREDYWAKVAEEMNRKYHREITYYCDYASPDYIDYLDVQGIDARYADKNVFEGISLVASLIKGGKFNYSTNEAETSLNESSGDEEQETFIDEIYQYVWSKDGDRPVKEFDHVLDAIRYAIFTEHLENENGLKTFKF